MRLLGFYHVGLDAIPIERSKLGGFTIVFGANVEVGYSGAKHGD